MTSRTILVALLLVALPVWAQEPTTPPPPVYYMPLWEPTRMNLIVADEHGIAVTIHHDGTVDLAPHVHPHRAARAFWRAIQRSFPDYCRSTRGVTR